MYKPDQREARRMEGFYTKLDNNCADVGAVVVVQFYSGVYLLSAKEQGHLTIPRECFRTFYLTSLFPDPIDLGGCILWKLHTCVSPSLQWSILLFHWPWRNITSHHVNIPHMWNSVFLLPFLLLPSLETVEPGFSVGRISEGQFEYSELNGWMTPRRARSLCENNSQCGGFTYKV